MASDKRDYTCPICLYIFIEPVTLPCKHTLCMPCYKQTVEKANLCCPICRRRISVWARLATKAGTLVDVVKWVAVKKMFPDLVQNRLDGKEELNQDDDDDNDDADDIETQLRRLKELSRPGEIRQEFEAALQQFQHRREEEVKLEEEASSALIVAIQEEEKKELEELKRFREELNKIDRETAEKLQVEALDTKWSSLTEQENKNPLSTKASVSSEKGSKTGPHSTSSTKASASSEKGSKTGQYSTSSTKASVSSEKGSKTGQHSTFSAATNPSNGKSSKTGKQSTSARPKKSIKTPAKTPSNPSLTLTTFFSPVQQSAGLPSSPDVNDAHGKKHETYKNDTKSQNNGYCMNNNDLPNCSSSNVKPAQESHENYSCRDDYKSQGCLDLVPQALNPTKSSPEKGKDALMFNLELNKKSSKYDNNAGQSVCGMSNAIEEVTPISFQTAEVEATSQSGDSYPKCETFSDNAVPYIYPSTSSGISVDHRAIISGSECSFVETVNDCLRNNELIGPQSEQNPILSSHTQGDKDLGKCQQNLGGNSQVCSNRGEISTSGDSGGSGASVQEIFGGLDEASTPSEPCRSSDYSGEPQEKIIAAQGVNSILGSDSVDSQPADLMSKALVLDSRQVCSDSQMAGSNNQAAIFDSQKAGLVSKAVVSDNQLVGSDSKVADVQQAKPTTRNVKNEPSVSAKLRNPQSMSIERWCVPDCRKNGAENNLKILSGKNLATNSSRSNSKKDKKLQDHSLKRKRSPSLNEENEADMKTEKPQAHSQKKKLLSQMKLQNGMFPVSKTKVGHEDDQLLGSEDKSGLSLEESDHQYALMLQEMYLKQDMRDIRVDRFKGSKDEYSLRKKLPRK